MPVGAIIGLILLGILCLIALLLFAPIRFRISYAGSDLKIRIRFLFIVYKLFPSKEKITKKKPPKPNKPQKAADAPPPQKTSPKKLLEQIMDILKVFWQKSRRRIRISIHRLYITVAASDAARCAILYGAVSQSVSYLLALIDSVFAIDKSGYRHVKVAPDYIAEESAFFADITLRTNLYQALRLLVFTKLHSVAKRIEQENTQNNSEKSSETEE